MSEAEAVATGAAAIPHLQEVHQAGPRQPDHTPHFIQTRYANWRGQMRKHTAE